MMEQLKKLMKERPDEKVRPQISPSFYRVNLAPRSDLDCFTVDWVLTTRF